MSMPEFTPVDLEANREGHLSEVQRKRLDVEVDIIERYAQYIALGMVLLFVVRVVLIPNNFAWLRSNPLAPFGMVIAFCISFAPFFALGWWVIQRHAQGHIHVVEGIAQVIDRDSEGRIADRSMYRVRIKRAAFRQKTFYFRDAESLAYFRTDQHYRVYYLKFYVFSRILSFEEIPDEKTKR